MNLLEVIPLLAALPKVEQAKLLADLEELEAAAGDVIHCAQETGPWLYFIIEGKVEIAHRSQDRSVPIVLLGPGELFGELGDGAEHLGEQEARALGPTHLCRLPLRRFREVMQSHPLVTKGFVDVLTERLASTMNELGRTKQMLTTYADELWGQVPLPELEGAVSAMPAEHVRAQPAGDTNGIPERSAAQPRTARKVQFPLLAPLLSAVAAFLISRYLWHSYQLAATGAILLWAACNWMLGTLPDYVIALATLTATVVTGAVTAKVALSGFATPSWFLLLGVFGIGVAVSRSGLLYRLSLLMLKLLPPSYRGQSFALAITGLLFTPLLPSANSRTAMASPLARELSEAMRFPPLSNGSAGMAMSSLLGFGQMYFLFLNGTSICMLAWSLLPDMTRQEITWSTWFWIALPLGLLTFAGCYIAILAMYPPEPSAGITRRTITAQLQVLGPMSPMERTTTMVLGLVLLGFITQSLHGLDPAWLALAGFLVLIATGVIDKNGLRNIDWGFMLLLGALVSLSDITKVTGLTDQLTQWVAPVLVPLGSSPYLFLGAVALLTLLIRLAVPVQQAVLVMVIALLPVSMQMGYHPFVITLVVLSQSNTWILPQQSPLYLTTHSGTEERAFTHAQVRPLALVHAAIGFVAVLASIPFWHHLGLLPR